MIAFGLPDVAGYRVRRLGRQDAPLIDALYGRCADFVRLAEGRDPAEGDGLALLRSRPPRVPIAHKQLFGLFEEEDGDEDCDGALTGLVDLVGRYPTPLTWYVGLLLIDPERRGRGIGTALCVAIRDLVEREEGRFIRLAVQSQNGAALRFWRRQGFAVIGTAEQRLGEVPILVYRLELALAEAPSA